MVLTILDVTVLAKGNRPLLQSAHHVMAARLTGQRREGEYHHRTIERPLSNENVMSLARIFPWALAAVVVGGGVYFLLAGHESAPQAMAPAPVTRSQIAPAEAMPSAEPSAEAIAPAEAMSRDGAAAEEKIKQDQDRETREMPAAPADMGMIDKEGIEKDAQDAAKAAARKP
jgi:hypothetical protein